MVAPALHAALSGSNPKARGFAGRYFTRSAPRIAVTVLAISLNSFSVAADEQEKLREQNDFHALAAGRHFQPDESCKSSENTCADLLRILDTGQFKFVAPLPAGSQQATDVLRACAKAVVTLSYPDMTLYPSGPLTLYAADPAHGSGSKEVRYILKAEDYRLQGRPYYDGFFFLFSYPSCTLVTASQFFKFVSSTDASAKLTVAPPSLAEPIRTPRGPYFLSIYSEKDEGQPANLALHLDSMTHGNAHEVFTFISK